MGNIESDTVPVPLKKTHRTASSNPGFHEQLKQETIKDVVQRLSTFCDNSADDLAKLANHFLRYKSNTPEQLSHLQKLYDSKTHGFSVTRIKELTFDYDGPLILLLKANEYLFCLASDHGLKDSIRTYGAVDSKLFGIYPQFAKLVSGRSAKLGAPTEETGIIYTNFTAKTARRGLLVGHQPISSPVIEIDEGFTRIKYTGGPPIKLDIVEIWAAGAPDKLDRLNRQKTWELDQVNKEKNRKFHLDEDWRQSTDRAILNLAGIQVYNSGMAQSSEPHKTEAPREGPGNVQ